MLMYIVHCTMYTYRGYEHRGVSDILITEITENSMQSTKWDNNVQYVPSGYGRETTNASGR